MIEKLTEKLYEGNYSCVIENDGVVKTFIQRGIADLYDIIQNEPQLLKGAILADKVIGKGAAALMVYGGVKEVFAGIISEPALALLNKAGVKTSYKLLVHHIDNRDKTDWCPLEKRCKTLDSVDESLPVIDQFVAMIRSSVPVN